MRFENWNDMSEKTSQLIKGYAEKCSQNYNIDPELYVKFNVKRGLRNPDGTGVLVGLTEIGDVHAYIIDENEKVPVEGRLMYRGIDLNEIVRGNVHSKKAGFEECAYLLLFGELPDKKQLDDFKRMLGENRKLPDGFVRDMILKAPSRDVMNKLARCVLSAYSYDDNPDDLSIENAIRQSILLIAYFPAFISYGYQAMSHYHLKDSLVIHSPEPELSTSENLLHMIRNNGKFTDLEAEVLDLALVLHAEHGGGNNSTFTTHVVTSTGTDIYSTIAASIGSLKGPKHGGASLKVMEMMSDLKMNVADWADEGRIAEYLKKLLNREAFDKSGLIYGLGHAVYTLSDPRAVLLKEKAQELADTKGMENEMNLYLKVEKLAPEIFAEAKGIDKGICINIDFYSGFVYKMLGIPQELYTPLFACSRVAGWCAHRIEEIISGGKIIRPAYKAVGKRRSYIPVDERQ